MSHQRQIAIIGLGYVGLPVAVAFGAAGRVIGFDINADRINALQEGHDDTLEVSDGDLASTDVLFTSDPSDLTAADFFIVAVPTPINSSKSPDLGALLSASKTVGRALSAGDIVVYESTVYPGATEDDCLPVLEKHSQLVGGVDFHVGYSPERINPGDKEHTLTRITKIIAAQTPESLDIVADVYGSIIEAGLHRASSIKVAEAAKVLENTQRDLNIALMNELAVILDRMDIDTLEVLEAAGTKWNFLPFRPGLVGGHCIGVDPYYLTHQAEKFGYHPEVILAGRRINDGMAEFIASRTIKKLIQSGADVANATVTVLGLTFKENCPDTRNSKVFDLIAELETYGLTVQCADAWADPADVERHYGRHLCPLDALKPAQAVILAVAHRQYLTLPFRDLCVLNAVFIDIKSAISAEQAGVKAEHYWRL